MNRDFVIHNLTPAKARLLVSAAERTNMYISPSIRDIAAQNILDEPDDLHQFIQDYNFRCVIPYSSDQRTFISRLSGAVPKDRKVILVTKDPILWVQSMSERVSRFSPENEDRIQYIDTITDIEPLDVLPVRDRLLIAKIAPEYAPTFGWLGRLFAEMIIFHHIPNPFMQNRPLHALSRVIYPELATINTTNSESNYRLMGCYDKLLPKKR